MHTITRLHITIEATQAVAWPHFAGSTLRGAFGRALRQAACITGQSHCTDCPLRNSCAYGVVFDPAPPKQPVHPSFRDGLPRYLVQAPALGARQLSPGQRQSFSLVLLPGAHTHQALIEHTLPKAAQQLLQGNALQLTDIQTSTSTLTPPKTTEPDHPNTKNSTTHILHWHTPLRLQHQGKPIFKVQQLNATTLVRALLRRQLQWCQLTGQTPPDPQPALQAATNCQLDTHQMQWHDMQRHSTRQEQKLPMGGLIGSAQLQGTAQTMHTLQPLLELGQQLHIGKETVMGLGRYDIHPNNGMNGHHAHNTDLLST